jgi:lysophospholipase L1-like esterase
MKRLAQCLAVMLAVVGSLQTTHASQRLHLGRVFYVAIGDGLTLGADSYSAVLARHLPPSARYHNLAAPYGTLADVLSSELPNALAARPTLVTMWLGGGNDGRVGTDLSTYRKEWDRVLTALQGTHARIFIGTQPDPRNIPFFTSRGPDFVKGVLATMRSFNVVITAEAKQHGAVMVDIFHASATIWGNPRNIVADGLHLNSAGENAVAGVFYRVMHSHNAL